MDSYEREIESLLKADGATLSRQRKHKCYTLSNGKLWIQSTSPGTAYSSVMELARLKRALGIQKTEATVGARRERKLKQKSGYVPAKFAKPAFNSALADKLQAVGVTEDRLSDEIAMLAYENELLRDVNAELAAEKAELLARVCECGWCVWKAWAIAIFDRLRRRVLLLD